MAATPRSLIVGLLFAGLHAPLQADTIRLKNGSWIHGKVSEPLSTQAALVIEAGGIGKLTIPRERVLSVEKNDLSMMPPAPPSAEPSTAGPRTERTSHVVRLKNGQRISGTLVLGPETEPLTLALGSLGRVSIPRDRITEVVESPGEIRIPAPAPPIRAPRRTAPEPPPSPPAPLVKAPPAPEASPAADLLDPELQAEIERNIYELTRWRTRNRVRAEKALVRIGAPAIPFLQEVARHPFELTRRAVMRIIRDIGDPEGIPMATEALLDEDSFVRELAAEALRQMGRVPSLPKPPRK